MTDNESDSESVTTDKQNPRTSWIYQLKTDDLKDQLEKFGVAVPRTAKERRKVLSEFIKGEIKPRQPASSAPIPTPPEGSLGADPATVCNVVRKWNLTFDGSKDVVTFLER